MIIEKIEEKLEKLAFSSHQNEGTDVDGYIELLARWRKMKVEIEESRKENGKGEGDRIMIYRLNEKIKKEENNKIEEEVLEMYHNIYFPKQEKNKEELSVKFLLKELTKKIFTFNSFKKNEENKELKTIETIEKEEKEEIKKEKLVKKTKLAKEIKKEIKKESYCVIDLETTGLSSKKDTIIEIGIVKVEDGEVVGQFEQLVNPKIKLKPIIKKLTGIKDEDLKDKPPLEDVMKDVVEFIGDCPLVGHNIKRFDIKFLKEKGENLGFSFDNELIDTLSLAQKKLDLPNNKLEMLVKTFKINTKGLCAHRALSDVLMTLGVYKKLKSL